MDAADLVARFWSLGGERTCLDAATLVRHLAAPDIALGNFLCAVRTANPERVATVLARADDLSGGRCRRVLVDDATPPPVPAQLALLDWRLESQLQLVLPRSVRPPEPERPMRPVDTGHRWQTVETLFRLDHLEEDARAGRPPRPAEDTHAAVVLRRDLATAARYFVAERDTGVVGCLGIWVGPDGWAVIEDVYVHPDARGAGVATQMLRYAVHHARANGAGPVLIAADPGDTPKHLYARFGFRPLAVTRSYTRCQTSLMGAGPDRARVRIGRHD